MCCLYESLALANGLFISVFMPAYYSDEETCDILGMSLCLCTTFEPLRRGARVILIC